MKKICKNCNYLKDKNINTGVCKLSKQLLLIDFKACEKYKEQTK